MRVDDARHAVTHQGAKDFLALSREAGLGTWRGTGAKHLNVKNHGKTWDIWEYNWDIQYLVSDIGWN